MKSQRPRRKIESEDVIAGQSVLRSDLVEVNDLHLCDIAKEMVSLSEFCGIKADHDSGTGHAPIDVIIDDSHLRDLIVLREVNSKWMVLQLLAKTFAIAVVILLLLVCGVAAASPDATTAGKVAGDLLGKASTFLVTVFGSAVLTVLVEMCRKPLTPRAGRNK
jgi:hypothetical protein